MLNFGMGEAKPPFLEQCGKNTYLRYNIHIIGLENTQKLVGRPAQSENYV